MENIKFIGAQNEIQKIYSDLGLIVPVGDLDNGKAPAIQPLPTTSTTTSITAKFNVMSGGDITALSYKVNDGEATSITPTKGVVTITIEDLEYNSGPYEIELTATNATGSTVTSSTVDLQHYTNWATTDEVLEGNKFIGEDGQEAVGTYVASEPVLNTLNVNENGTYTPDEGVDGYSEVTVNVSGGPSTGGATVQSCVMEWVEDPGTGEITRHTIVLDTMPEDIDPENHHYAVKVFALCYHGNSTDEPFTNESNYEHLADISGIEPAKFDLENNTIYDNFCSTPQDRNYNDIPSTSGYVVLYDGSFVNPIYKWPCTIITPPTEPEP